MTFLAVPALAQHEHEWAEGSPITQPHITLEKTYLRRGQITALSVHSIVDIDQCINSGCPFPNGQVGDVVVASWSDGDDMDGQFGYLDASGNFVPSASHVTHYKASETQSGVVHITLTLDDLPLYYDDNPVTNPLDNANLTVWEFGISPAPPDWRPRFNNEAGYFTAAISPSVDHLGNSMRGFIRFSLSGSSEPSYCLNACCEAGYQFCQNNNCPIFPYCAFDAPPPFSVCPWRLSLAAIGELWRSTTSDDSDLKFPPNQSGFDIDDPACVNAITTQLVLSASVRVFCLDYGAFGILTAHCSHPILGEIAARMSVPDDWYSAWLMSLGADGDYTVSIPYDWDVDALADSWEAQHGAAGDAPGKDEDETPAGDGTRGDGLSAYEEYRGLLWRGQWMEFDPTQKDMFVMNFGAGHEDPYEPPTIPNDAITSPNGFPGAGMPQLWLLNANEGAGYPLRVVNFLSESFHNRDVYAAVVVPSADAQPDLAETSGPIWDVEGPPVIEANADEIKEWGQVWGINEHLSLATLIGHELGHTVLWEVDHNRDDNSQHFGGDSGHHVIGQDGKIGQHTPQCLMWPFFPPRTCPNGFVLCYPAELYSVNYCPQRDEHWEQVGGEWRPRDRGNWIVFNPTEFCAQNPGCQSLWRLNPQ